MLYSEEDYELLRQHNWKINPKGYVVSYKSKCTLLAHRLIIDCPASMQVDHINGNRADNRRENLRIVTSQQNNFNRGLNSNSTTGYKGVSYKIRDNRYQARIKHNGKSIQIGYFLTALEAHVAYEAKAKELFGEFYKTP